MKALKTYSIFYLRCSKAVRNDKSWCFRLRRRRRRRIRKGNEDIDIVETEQISKTHRKMRERKRMSDIGGRRLMDLHGIYMCMRQKRNQQQQQKSHNTLFNQQIPRSSRVLSILFLSCSSFLSALFRKSRIETETCLFINADYYLLAFV